MANMEIYSVEELMTINDSLMEYLGDEQGYRAVANLMAAGDRCKEVVKALENRSSDIYAALAAADVNVEDANWTKLIASWIVSYVIEYEEPVAIENESWQ